MLAFEKALLIPRAGARGKPFRSSLEREDAQQLASNQFEGPAE
jgi:hypothetical protein